MKFLGVFLKTVAAIFAFFILTACGGGGGGGGGGGSSNNDPVTPDTTSPVVVEVKGISADGVYSIGSKISLSISFSEPVFVAGVPRLLLQNSIFSQARYVSGSGTNLLRFEFNVVTGDSTNDLAYYSSTQLILSSATIRDQAGNDADLRLPQVGNEGSLSFNSNIVVDGNVPFVRDVVTTSPSGTYSTGDTISISLVYSEPIKVLSGAPKLLLETGDVDAIATYTGYSNNTLMFEYLVSNNHTSSHLAFYGNAYFITDAEIQDYAGNNISRYMPVNGNDWYSYLPFASDSSLYKTSFIQVNPASGPIDTSYGKYGRAIKDLPFYLKMFAFASVKQSTNTLICATGYEFDSTHHIACTRFTSAGNIDSTYGTDGLRLNPEPALKVVELSLQADGKMLIAGNSSGIFPSSSDSLCRYTSDVSIDTSFGVNGCIVGLQFIQALSIQNDGKILLVTGLRGSPPYKVYRYDSEGSPDQTFGPANSNVVEINGGDLFPKAIEVQTDGKILIAGHTGAVYTKNAAVARFLSDGQPDISFGTNGIANHNFSGDDEYHEVKVLPDLSIIAAGTLNGKYLISKYTSQGILDPIFDEDGSVITSPWLESGYAENILVEQDGSFIVIGQSQSPGSLFVAMKY